MSKRKIQNRHHLSQTKHPKGPLKHRKPSELYEKLYGKRESPKIPIHSLKKQEANLNVQYNGLGFRRAIARLLYQLYAENLKYLIKFQKRLVRLFNMLPTRSRQGQMEQMKITLPNNKLKKYDMLNNELKLEKRMSITQTLQGLQNY